MKISAFLPVFNEEARISSAIESILWCDEIIVLDKHSSDKTVEIAKRFGSKIKVHFMENTPYYNSNEWDYLIKETTGDWVIRFTASDLIHPELAKEIRKLISSNSISEDVIYVPFNRYVLGINNSRSPWYSEVCPMIFRKSTLSVNKLSVHESLNYGHKSYTINLPREKGMYHLTHESADTMMTRHLRYLRSEASEGGHQSFFKAFWIVCKEIFKVVFWKKTFFMGWDGIMLSFAYLSYYMMSFVYKWDVKRGNSANLYVKLREEIHNAWDKEMKGNNE